MEGGGERKFPVGFRFKPRDDELVEFYLLPKLQGRPIVPTDAVVEANVYEHHPDTLTGMHRSGGGEEEQEEWYFLSSRQRMYGNGVRPARKTRDGRGRWKASTATKEVAEEVVCDGGFKFCKSVLNYFEGVPKKEARTKWIMLELTVPEYEIKLDNPGAKNMVSFNLFPSFILFSYRTFRYLFLVLFVYEGRAVNVDGPISLGLQLDSTSAQFFFSLNLGTLLIQCCVCPKSNYLLKFI
jgi:hypothetical protein